MQCSVLLTIWVFCKISLTYLLYGLEPTILRIVNFIYMFCHWSGATIHCKQQYILDVLLKKKQYILDVQLIYLFIYLHYYNWPVTTRL